MFVLQQNYPNRFNSPTSITNTIQTESKVKVALFDMLGRKIETLRQGNQTLVNMK